MPIMTNDESSFNIHWRLTGGLELDGTKVLGPHEVPWPRVKSACMEWAVMKRTENQGSPKGAGDGWCWLMLVDVDEAEWCLVAVQGGYRGIIGNHPWEGQARLIRWVSLRNTVDGPIWITNGSNWCRTPIEINQICNWCLSILFLVN